MLCCKNHRSSHWRCFLKEASRKKTLPISKENTLYCFIKKRLQRRCFPVELAKFLRICALKNIGERLLLKIGTFQKKLSIDFFYKIMAFIITTITFEDLRACFFIIFVSDGKLYNSVGVRKRTD